MTRDISQAQFDRECAKRGFVAQGFLGYYSMPDVGIRVSIHNAGARRRTQLAYLIGEHVRWCEKEGVVPEP